VARDVGKGVVCSGGDGGVDCFADGEVDVVPGGCHVTGMMILTVIKMLCLLK
jgi:hypothetical protein